jgi:hypothetical protein
MGFSVGDRVVVVDEHLEGEIIEINEKEVILRDEDGFDYTYQLHQLYRKEGENTLSFESRSTFNFNTALIKEFKKEEPPLQADFKISFKGKKPEFDLHIEEIAWDKKFKTPYDKLMYQLLYVKSIIHKAIQGRQRNIILIHGKGKGRLREEIEDFLRTEYPNVEMVDASYQKYGGGALELFIHGMGKL